MQVTRINERGMRQIAAALAEHHQPQHFTASMLAAWAAEAEASHEAGNGCYIEIPARSSVTKAAIEVVITRDGYDVAELADE